MASPLTPDNPFFSTTPSPDGDIPLALTPNSPGPQTPRTTMDHSEERAATVTTATTVATLRPVGHRIRPSEADIGHHVLTRRHKKLPNTRLGPSPQTTSPPLTCFGLYDHNGTEHLRHN
ncbi:hypothetical protein SKAU_G00415620 [Synaphobranchus kaupii]|uniref:Uncharacterized protein n=1 Tax=Synaphobranchus kaupii TaxID=118154 RepID=A0A9Q1IBH5_SYNKA|nr:hypothetical protein SKAU_G00415620 [Synaphobranchus kaupii]